MKTSLFVVLLFATEWSWPDVSVCVFGARVSAPAGMGYPKWSGKEKVKGKVL